MNKKLTKKTNGRNIYKKTACEKGGLLIIHYIMYT